MVDRGMEKRQACDRFNGTPIDDHLRADELVEHHCEVIILA